MPTESEIFVIFHYFWPKNPKNVHKITWCAKRPEKKPHRFPDVGKRSVCPRSMAQTANKPETQAKPLKTKASPAFHPRQASPSPAPHQPLPRVVRHDPTFYNLFYKFQTKTRSAVVRWSAVVSTSRGRLVAELKTVNRGPPSGTSVFPKF